MKFRGPSWLVKGTTGIGTVATVASLVLLYLDVSGRLWFWGETAVMWADTGLCLIMLAEWYLLFSWAEDKRQFLKTRWIDFFAALPLLLLLRPFRIVRVIRLLRLLRGIALFAKLVRPWRRLLHQSLFWNTAGVAVILILLGAVGIMDLERENPNLDEFGEAIWWAVVTTTTVGYGDAYPMTTEGRYIAGMLMILGVGLFGTFAASMTSALSKGDSDASNREILMRIDQLERRIDRVLKDAQRPTAAAPDEDEPRGKAAA